MVEKDWNTERSNNKGKVKIIRACVLENLNVPGLLRLH